jgi:cytochrome c5
MLKSFLLFAAVVLLVIASASAPARPPQESGAAVKKMNSEALAKAKKVYNMDCALCHGATGDGKTDLAKDMQLTMADWTDPKTLAGQTDQQLFDTIRKGKGKMPAEEEGRAKNDEVHALVMYIRTFAKEGAAAPAAPATEQPAPAAPATGQPATPAQTPQPQAPSSSPSR